MNPQLQAQHFSRLALVLVQAVKSLQNYVKSLEILSDKQIEEKLSTLKEILDFDFQLPQNISISIIQILIQCLSEKVDAKKDFLITKINSLIEMVVLKVDGNILVQGTLEGLVFDYIKWVLVQVKVEQTQQEIQSSALKNLLAICDKLPKPRLNEILPGFSSTITKVLSNDIKVHLKIKLQMIEIWKVILQSVFDNKKVKQEEKNQGQIKLKLMKQLIQVTKNIEGKLEKDLQIKNSDESEIRLNDCFKYIMDNIYKSIDQNKVIEGLQSLTSKLLLKLERNSILLLNLLLLNRLCGGNFVLKQSQISITLKQKIYEQFHQSIIRLKKTKNMINTNERTIALKRLSTLTELMQQLDTNISNREDIPLLFANFSSLIVFESQRFMIQEVKKVDLEKIQKLQIDQASQEVKEFKLKKESQQDTKVLNEKYVREYFQQSIEIFQDDSEFQIQFTLILQSLPDSFKIEMMDILFNDLLQLDNLQKQDTSKTLQQRCMLVYLSSFLKSKEMNQRLIQYSIDQLELNQSIYIKYPIQERYQVVLYHCINECLKDLNINLLTNILTKNKVFSFAFSGLSSSHEAVSSLSKNILSRFIEDHSNCNNLNDILQFDNRYSKIIIQMLRVFIKILLGKLKCTQILKVIEIKLMNNFFLKSSLVQFAQLFFYNLASDQSTETQQLRHS